MIFPSPTADAIAGSATARLTTHSRRSLHTKLSQIFEVLDRIFAAFIFVVLKLFRFFFEVYFTNIANDAILRHLRFYYDIFDIVQPLQSLLLVTVYVFISRANIILRPVAIDFNLVWIPLDHPKCHNSTEYKCWSHAHRNQTELITIVIVEQENNLSNKATDCQDTEEDAHDQWRPGLALELDLLYTRVRWRWIKLFVLPFCTLSIVVSLHFIVFVLEQLNTAINLSTLSVVYQLRHDMLFIPTNSFKN